MVEQKTILRGEGSPAWPEGRGGFEPPAPSGFRRCWKSLAIRAARQTGLVAF